MFKYVWTEKYNRVHFLFNLLQIHLLLQQLLTHVNKYLLQIQSYIRVLPQSYGHRLVFHTG